MEKDRGSYNNPAVLISALVSRSWEILEPVRAVKHGVKKMSYRSLALVVAFPRFLDIYKLGLLKKQLPLLFWKSQKIELNSNAGFIGN